MQTGSEKICKELRFTEALKGDKQNHYKGFLLNT